jgi:hypothetical protein
LDHLEDRTRAVFPGNYPLIRPVTANDAGVLRALTEADRRAPLRGRIFVAELRGEVVAAISGDYRRTIANRSVTPTYVIARLRMHLSALEADEREADLGKRIREAVVGPRRVGGHAPPARRLARTNREPCRQSRPSRRVISCPPQKRSAGA